jgi:hypothetical protein
MKRILLIAAGAVIAGGVAATPAIAGVAGNPSFSHTISVPVPSTAKSPHFVDDHKDKDKENHGHKGKDDGPGHEKGDDGGRKTVTVSASPSATPTDDHGGLTPHAEPTDDRGGHGDGRGDG